MAVTKASAPVGKDIIYVCTHCQNREKEFAFSDRQYKYCSKCGSVSVKSTLTDSYNYLTPPFVTEQTQDEYFGDYER